MPTNPNPTRHEDEIREEFFESTATGIELEIPISDYSEDPEPWDPEKIRIHTRHYSLRQVVDMICENDIDLAPDFQRNFVWTSSQRSGLIESLLLGIPLPSFYFNENELGQLEVVDGVQRLTTISNYINDPKETLKDLIYLHDLKGKCFGELDAVYRRRLNNAQFVAHVIDPETPYRVKFDIFNRINTGGTPLSSQEIRHCMSKPRSRNFLKVLANDPSFIIATDKALLNHPRMADREVALRFVAFRLFDSDHFSKYDSFNEFLGDVTIQLDTPGAIDLDQLHSDFMRGMRNSHTVFRGHAFRKWPFDAANKLPINRGLFESWGTALADYDDDYVKFVAEDLCHRARKMMTEDREFMESISTSTGTVRNVRIRMEKVRELVKEFLQ